MPLTKPDKNNVIININDESSNNCDAITSHLYIKPSHSKQTLDKDMVLRRIRHRKRMNNFRSAFQSFIGSSSSSSSSSTKMTKNGKGSSNELKWVDDAFAAL
ncbi:hypothetical protein ES288_D06G015000v1 [Gossypium darwinii]|uniref:Uncharacterized protein n=1 Tax=Gossypium darwinii TaxID=34276 RepID=A0A5D2C547_GOSDA|nr:hypothetical protein ES288_D06G015000v1 [Gossypium darwinii]